MMEKQGLVTRTPVWKNFLLSHSERGSFAERFIYGRVTRVLSRATVLCLAALTLKFRRSLIAAREPRLRRQPLQVATSKQVGACR